ncbi:hypothetical protein [Streptomyces pharetrae]|uniref:hypothetical protein n=1 Tax=Streptomyces pharetrae TaxID=291370 RepID=UPI001302E17B
MSWRARPAGRPSRTPYGRRWTRTKKRRLATAALAAAVGLVTSVDHAAGHNLDFWRRLG